MGDRWEKQSRKPEQVEDNAKALGVFLVKADTLYGRLLVQQPGNGHHAGAALPAQPPEPDGI